MHLRLPPATPGHNRASTVAQRAKKVLILCDRSLRTVVTEKGRRDGTVVPDELHWNNIYIYIYIRTRRYIIRVICMYFIYTLENDK